MSHERLLQAQAALVEGIAEDRRVRLLNESTDEAAGDLAAAILREEA